MVSDNTLINGSIKFKILRSTKWEFPLKIIGDETRSGASKIRLAHSANRRKFSAVFQMDSDNAVLFEAWYEKINLFGFNHFFLPRINSANKDAYGVYRFAPDTKLSWSNTAGKILEVSFDLEEID